MENNLYKFLSFLLVKTGSISDSDNKLYEYAIRILVQGLINITASILIGIFFNMVKECLCILLVFFVLRKFTGGLHTKKYITCLICSLLILIASLIFVKVLLIYSIPKIFFALVIISILIISILSPIENEKKKLSNREKKLYKSISIILSLFFGILTQSEDMYISYSIGTAIMMIAILIVLAKTNEIFNNKMEEHNGK